jgi:hypothetical protein
MGSEQVSAIEFLTRIQGVHIGVDVGQKVDHSAIVVAEVSERPTTDNYYDYATNTNKPRMESVYTVQELRRLPLGTPFTAVVKEVVSLVGAVHEMERELRRKGSLTQYEHSLSVDIFIDATGLGAPIVELLRDAINAKSKTDHAMIHPTTFTYGDRYVRGDNDGTGDSLGKGHLVSRLQILLEQDRLLLPKRSPDIDAMLEELRLYEIRMTDNANEQYGAFLVGTHDDMVTALGLACVEDPGYYKMTVGPSLW